MSRRLRIVASGTLFITHTLSVNALPNQNTTRASAVRRERGGASATVLSVLAQFTDVEAYLVAPVGGGPEGAAMIKELETAGVKTKLCARRDASGIPAAYIICAADGTKSVVNHNPIPDVLHDEFIRLVAPLLTPPTPPGGPEPDLSLAPFEWLHFEGRNVQTTLSNLTGLDGLAIERGWRNKVVFSIEISRPGRQGQEALIRHADVVFFSHAYATAQEYTAPRPFLLAMARFASPHALLCAEWGRAGCAMLSVPTKEYFQSSAFVPDPRTQNHRTLDSMSTSLFESVRSGTPFYSEMGDPRAPSRAEVNGNSNGRSISRAENRSASRAAENRNGDKRRNRGQSTSGQGQDDWGKMYPESVRRASPAPSSSSEEDERRTITGASWRTSVTGTTSSAAAAKDIIEEAGGGDAFVAGMIFALSRRLVPGAPYSPGLQDVPGPDAEKGRWRLEECLRFGTEMVGRKIRRKGFEGLARAMEEVGWFED
ncbi:PfkB family carbohydrate kinase [Ceratobasidium sp. AG-Ba]|nr:PfkB family carbohydrate kinase [Ceratobasidium sp. AG-Ba]